MTAPLRWPWTALAHRWSTRRRAPRSFAAFASPAYRLPLTGAEAPTGIQPRRSDYALWYLLDQRVLAERAVRAPLAVTYAQLLLVHTPEYLESLSQAGKLADIFAVDSSDVPVDELLRSLRLACGGTLGAARAALESRSSTLNFSGGFHHAGPSRGGGFCALNDMAVALKVLRGEGFSGDVAVLDLDAHPPDGTRECLAGDPRVWIGSLSGSDWGALPGVDETVLPQGCPDAPYLAALDALLGRMPRAELTFVLAGGDVLSGDRFGVLGLTLRGARERDARAFRACEGRATVWLPAGGYREEAWKVLAGTALVLAGRVDDRIPRDFDPLSSHFAAISRSLTPESLSGEGFMSDEELGEAMRIPGAKTNGARFLGYYTLEGIELALERYGVLPHLARLGYAAPRLLLQPGPDGERLELFAQADGTEHLLIDLIASRRSIGGSTYLFSNWLSLRNPRARFSERRPRLPGQEVPGLGIAMEVGELLGLIARRLGLAGVAFRPSSYHVAYAARRRFRFVDPHRQGRFEALMRDLHGLSLLEATNAIDGTRVRFNGAPYAWEADEMVERHGEADDAATIDAAALAAHFDTIPGPDST